MPGLVGDQQGPAKSLPRRPQSYLHVTSNIFWLLSSSCRLSPVPPNGLHDPHDPRFGSTPASSTAGALAVESRDGRAGEPLL
jgi:hypothetical protein